MTELDGTGDPDSAGRYAAPGGGVAPDRDDGEGRTQVIGAANDVGPIPGPAGDSPTVRVPVQAGPPRPVLRPGPTAAPLRRGPTAGIPAPARQVPPFTLPAPRGAATTYGSPTLDAPASAYAPPARGGYGGAPAGYDPSGYDPSGYGRAPAGFGGAPAGYDAGRRPAWAAHPPAAAGFPPPGAYPAPPAGPPGAAPPPLGGSAAPPGGPRYRALLIALVAVVALAAACVGVYLTLRSTGGATPVEATRLLVDDLDAGDWGGAVSRLHPDEVTLGSDLGGMLHDELVRLQVVRPDAERDALLHGVTVANLRFDDTAVEQVRPDVAIAKLVGGTVTVNRDVNALPLTDSYKRLAYPKGVPPAQAPEVVDIAKVVADQGRPVRIATVQVDGRWYVSVAYTIADNALVRQGEAWPQGTIASRGAATAQDALRESVSALFAQDARRLVELAPPHELAVVHDVGPLLVERAGTARPGGGRLVDLATTPAGVPGGTALTVDRIVVDDGRGAQFTAVRDGDCLAVTPSRGAPTRLCAQDVAAQGVGSVPDATDPAVRDVMVRVARAALGLRVVVVEDGGQYYVSPLRTMVGLGIDVLHTLQPPDLARLMTIST